MNRMILAALFLGLTTTVNAQEFKGWTTDGRMIVAGDLERYPLEIPRQPEFTLILGMPKEFRDKHSADDGWLWVKCPSWERPRQIARPQADDTKVMNCRAGEHFRENTVRRGTTDLRNIIPTD